MGDRLECMSEQHKADLRRYLQEGREAMVWKLVGCLNTTCDVR